MLKKKNCSGTKGYSCGRSCISVKKVCRKDGLTGQSVKLLNDFVEAIKPARLTVSEIQKLDKVGSGAFGTVYKDAKGNAFKVEEGTALTLTLNTDKLLGKGISKPTKSDILKGAQDQAKTQNLAAKAGYSPRVFDVYTEDNNVITKMEYLDGYETVEKAAINGTLDIKTAKAKVAKIKEYFKAQGINHYDLHTDNAMYNPNTKDLKIIDFGLSKLSNSSLTATESNNQFKLLETNLK